MNEEFHQSRFVEQDRRSDLAIAAGYLGAFSIIPFVAPIALIFGICAVRDLHAHPEKTGKGRAWFAIVFGGIVTVLFLGLVVLGALINKLDLESSGDATPSVAVEGNRLSGMCGKRFGAIIEKGLLCNTNNVGALAFHFDADRQIRGFQDYVLFATPLTRQVSRIRATCPVVADEGPTLMEETVRAFERQFGKEPKRFGLLARAFLFENGDHILVSRNANAVIVDAICNLLDDQMNEEVRAVEAKLYAADVAALEIQPTIPPAGRANALDSVLGQTFGCECADSKSAEQMPDGYWANEFCPTNKFMGCTEYRAFCTAKTRKVFMVRAVYEGDDAEIRFDHIKRVVERSFGRKMEEKKDSADRFMRFGDILITLERNANGGITLDFTSILLYKENQKEQAAPAK